jgi:dolichol-phosphate mannosyltransferase
VPSRPDLHARPVLLRAALLGVAAARLARGARAEPPLAPVAGSPARPVTVVVPARDEEQRIGPCLAGLAGEGVEVVVVDDGSTDRTREVAEAAGARVVAAGPLPPGWAGKAHALDVGLREARTDVVVFIDADTRPQPGFVAAAVDALGGATLVSGGARVDAPSAGEQLVHPAMLTTLVYRLGPPGVPARRPERTMANGQCTVVDRCRLLDAGGFGPVRDALLEDLALARWLAGRGHEVRFVDATDCIDVEGYGSLAAAWRGWGRSLDLAPVTSTPWQLADLAVVWSTLALPLPRLLAGRGDALDVAALALRVGTLVGTRRAYRHAGPAYWLSPLADLAVAMRITAGTVRPDRRWRGRSY